MSEYVLTHMILLHFPNVLFGNPPVLKKHPQALILLDGGC